MCNVVHVFPVLCIIAVTCHNRTNTGKDDITISKDVTDNETNQLIKAYNSNREKSLINILMRTM